MRATKKHFYVIIVITEYAKQGVLPTSAVTEPRCSSDDDISNLVICPHKAHVNLCIEKTNSS